MKNYAEYYARLSRPYRPYAKQLRLVNQSVTTLMYAVYPLLLTFLFLEKGGAATLPYVLVPGIGFVLLSLVRKILNQPRPYERWDIEPLIEKDSSGQSMPSRHVFSATIISMCLLTINFWLGLLLLILSALLAFCRVIGGVHYPKDVLVGYAIGVLVGLVLFWIG